MTTITFSVVLIAMLQVVTILRVLLRPHREPTARIAWIAVVALVPGVGILAYLFLGEVSIGRKHITEMKKVLARMPKLAGPVKADAANIKPKIPGQFAHLFKLGASISGFAPVGGNSAELMADSDAMITALVADIDGATDHVHTLFYIWLSDTNGCKVVEALKRAAKRGVTCRAMADGMGSRAIIASPHWRAMADAGVNLGVVLPIGNAILKVFTGRFDLRNHRKIVVIDDTITYCGSQNCADAAFSPKPKYAPWVDAVLRLTGPIARQNQHLFVRDWMVCSGQDLTSMLDKPLPCAQTGFTAQVIGTGPTERHLAMSQMFVASIAAARKELIISTPYYVPNEAIQSALQAAAYRGVKTTIIFPAKNDSMVVQAASQSYYHELLDSGVTIYEYTKGLLHTKSLTIDGEFTLIGSANIDRRSFDLNYENNMLIADKKIVADIISRQRRYIKNSQLVTVNAVEQWSAWRRLWNNAIAVLGPIL